MSDPTLGDILAAVLAGSLPPAPAIERSLELTELETQSLSAWVLARDLADHAGIAASDVYDTLCTVPDNMLGLLDSPQGWTALANVVAADNGLPDLRFIPTIH